MAWSLYLGECIEHILYGFDTWENVPSNHSVRLGRAESVMRSWYVGERSQSLGCELWTEEKVETILGQDFGI